MKFFQQIKGSQISKTLAVIMAVICVFSIIAQDTTPGIIVAMPFLVWLIFFLLLFYHFKNQEDIKTTLNSIAHILEKETPSDEDDDYEYLDN